MKAQFDARARRGRGRLAWFALVVLGCVVCCQTRASARLTPESPEVRAAVDRALVFLEKQNDKRFGHAVLAGLAALKAGKKDHVLVQRGLDAAQQLTSLISMGQPLEANCMYTLGMAVIFLIEHDPSAHASEVQTILNHMLSIQKAHGGFGYTNLSTGDTSMTQFAILAMWMASEVGYDVPEEHWVRVTNWLLRTQDPSGGYGYQGRDPGSFTLVEQEQVRETMSAAGAGGLYMVGEHLGLLEFDAKENDTPPGLKLRKKRERGSRPAVAGVDTAKYHEGRKRADGWMDSHHTVEAKQWPLYFLYALERYKSFRDLVEGRTDPSPDWYNEGANYLLKSQLEDGKWIGSPVPEDLGNTCFGVLFLMRSMREIIKKVKAFGGGTLAGGRGLPDGDDVVLGLDGVKSRALSGPADQVLQMLDDPDQPEVEKALARLHELAEAGDQELLTKHQKKLRDLAKDGSPQAKAAAIKALARTRDLDVVPLLIEALRNPEPLVYSEAELGLRFISRKFEGVLPGDDESEAGRLAALEKWKEWFMSIRPDARFEE